MSNAKPAHSPVRGQAFVEHQRWLQFGLGFENMVVETAQCDLGTKPVNDVCLVLGGGLSVAGEI